MGKRKQLLKGLVLTGLCAGMCGLVACGIVDSDKENGYATEAEIESEVNPENAQQNDIQQSDTPQSDTPQNDSSQGNVQQEGESQSDTEDGQSVYEADGYLAERTDLLNDKMLEKSGKHFTALYKKYLEPNGIEPYFAIIPDKNYYLTGTEEIKADFDKMVEKLLNQCPFMQYIDIRDRLTIEDYYRTDSHWKQDCIAGVAEYLCEKMGNTVHAEYETRKLGNLLEGSYYNEIKSDIQPDEVNYLVNEELEQCTVSKYEGMEPDEAVLYDMEKAESDNPYDMFLGGAVPIVTIKNPQADTGRKLVMFRDSFASSIAPLMVSGYESVTLVDIRYILSGMVGDFVDFKDSDVLFLYSSILLNNSAGMK